jgi:hypothetical protein
MLRAVAYLSKKLRCLTVPILLPHISEKDAVETVSDGGTLGLAVEKGPRRTFTFF